MRLDLFLFKEGLAESRSRARELIERGLVRVEGRVVNKPSYSVVDEKVEVLESLKYVSRAGEKLEAALDRFGIDVQGKLCLDVGSSTGGFTQCLLERGAGFVYALDVGKNQLHPSLREDERVKLFEETDIRDFKVDILFDFVAVDVSFISLKLVLPKVYQLLKDGGELVALFKPQFEVGKGNTKKGIVKDRKLVERVKGELIGFANSLGFCFMGSLESPIKGKKGNLEHLLYFVKR